MNASLLMMVVLAGSPLMEHLDGYEIGDATQSVTFESGGRYVGQRKDKAGRSAVEGAWQLDGDKLSVKVAKCTGPACKDLGQPFAASVEIVAERAMTVKSEPDQSALSTGSYYCHYDACEKRTGVVLVSAGAKASVTRYLLDFLIDKNRPRDVTVVWVGKKLDAKQPTQLSYCGRDAKRAQAGATQLAKDVAALAWMPKLEAKASADASCLWDVQLVLGEEVSVPKKK